MATVLALRVMLTSVIKPIGAYYTKVCLKSAPTDRSDAKGVAYLRLTPRLFCSELWHG